MLALVQITWWHWLGFIACVLIFLALELFSICLYVLAGFARVRPKSQEAAVKNFLLSAFASGFLLYGMALTYGETGSTQLATINSFLATHASAADPVLLVGMGLMIVGLSFKMAAVYVATTWSRSATATPVTSPPAAGTSVT